MDVVPHHHRHLPPLLQHHYRPQSPPSPSSAAITAIAALIDSPPPPCAAVESIGELITGRDMQALAASIGHRSSEEPEETSDLIFVDEGAGRDKIELDSPPPPSASADVKLSGEGTRTQSLEEGPGEATRSIATVESAQRDIEELHMLISTEENEGEEGELEEILEPTCNDESAGSQLHSSAAASADSIGGEVGNVSLEEEQEVTIEHFFSLTASEATPSPLLCKTKASSPVFLRQYNIPTT